MDTRGDRSLEAGARGRGWTRALPLAVLCAATAIVFATGAHRFLSFQSLADQRGALREIVAAHAWTASLAYAGLYVVAVALSVPGAALLTVAGGFLFGWAAGSALAVVAATTGAILVFLAARTSLSDLPRRLAGPRLDRLADGLREGAFSYLMVLRLVPVFPFWLVNLAAALLGVPFATFAATTLIGIVPGTVAFAVAGAGLDDLVAGRIEARRACLDNGGGPCDFDFSIGAVLTPGVLATLAALAVLSLIPIIVKKLGLRAPAIGARPPSDDP